MQLLLHHRDVPTDATQLQLDYISAFLHVFWLSR